MKCVILTYQIFGLRPALIQTPCHSRYGNWTYKGKKTGKKSDILITITLMVLFNKYKRADNSMHCGIESPRTYQCFCLLMCFFSNSYDSEGRLMNVTFPTGMVNNLYTDIYSALTVDIESSMTEEEISITTNTSTIRAFYTLAQGKGAARLPDSGSDFVSRYLSLFRGSSGQCWVSLSRVSLQLRGSDRRQCKWLLCQCAGFGVSVQPCI